MTIIDVALERMVDNLEQYLGDAVRKVRSHDGDVNVPMLKSYATTAPMVFVVPQGGMSLNQSGTVQDHNGYEVYILTSKRSTGKKTELALALRELVTRWVFTDILGEGDDLPYQTPTQSETKNYYGTELDQMGLALWSVSFTVRIDLEPLPDPNCGEFRTLHAEYYQPGDDPDEVDTPVTQTIDVRSEE